MSSDYQKILLARMHARKWLLNSERTDFHDIMFLICENIDDEEYRIAIENEIYNANTQENIISKFHAEIDLFKKDILAIENIHNKSMHDFKFIKIKPNTNNITIDI